MNLYFWNSVQVAFKESLIDQFKTKKERKIVFADFMENYKLSKVAKKDFVDELYVSKSSTILFDEMQLAKIMNAIKNQFGFDIQDPQSTKAEIAFTVSDYLTFEDAVEQIRFNMNGEHKESKDAVRAAIKEEKKAESIEKIQITEKLNSQLSANFKSNRIMAIDFEFDSNKDWTILECGMAIFKDGVISYEHYIVNDTIGENHYPKDVSNKFLFGNSQFVTVQELLIIVKDRLLNVDYLIGHSVSSEHIVLKHHGIDILSIDNLKVIDSQGLMKSRFNFYFENMKNKSVSLSNMLHILKIEHNSLILHNAGNDAAYTLMAVLQMVEFIEHPYNIQKKRIKIAPYLWELPKMNIYSF
jgi:hypothetical protein